MLKQPSQASLSLCVLPRDSAALCFFSLPFLAVPRLVYPANPKTRGPTENKKQSGNDRMNWKERARVHDRNVVLLSPFVPRGGLLGGIIIEYWEYLVLRTADGKKLDVLSGSRQVPESARGSDIKILYRTADIRCACSSSSSQRKSEKRARGMSFVATDGFGRSSPDSRHLRSLTLHNRATSTALLWRIRVLSSWYCAPDGWNHVIPGAITVRDNAVLC